MRDEMPIWLHGVDDDCRSLCPTISSGLRQHGIGTSDRARLGATSGGILLFSRFSERLCDDLRAFSNDAMGGVIAIALHAEALGGGKAWQLLEAGAWDVFGWDSVPDPVGVAAARLERWADVDRLLCSPA